MILTEEQHKRFSSGCSVHFEYIPNLGHGSCLSPDVPLLGVQLSPRRVSDLKEAPGLFVALTLGSRVSTAAFPQSLCTTLHPSWMFRCHSPQTNCFSSRLISEYKCTCSQVMPCTLRCSLLWDYQLILYPPCSFRSSRMKSGETGCRREGAATHCSGGEQFLHVVSFPDSSVR